MCLLLYIYIYIALLYILFSLFYMNTHTWQDVQICNSKVPVFPDHTSNASAFTYIASDGASDAIAPEVRPLTGNRSASTVAVDDVCERGEDDRHSAADGTSPLLSNVRGHDGVAANTRTAAGSKVNVGRQPTPLDYDALLTEAAQSSQKSRTPRHQPKLYMNVRWRVPNGR